MGGWLASAAAVALAALAALAAARLVLWACHLDRRPGMTHEEWLSLDPDDRASWARHPSHARRCKCGAWALPWDPTDAVVDESGVHGLEQCATIR